MANLFLIAINSYQNMKEKIMINLITNIFFSEDECKVMVSKMKPLWLTWKNSSKLAKEVGKEDVKYIVKNGDGTDMRI